MRIDFTGGNGSGSNNGTHEVLGNVRYCVRELGMWPDRQVAGTIEVMRERVGEDSGNPEFQEWAGKVAGDGDDVEKVGNAFDHVKSALRFHRDETTAAQLAGINAEDVIEIIIRPLDMKRYVEQGIAIGDCDDYSMYLAALLEAVGIQCSFVTVAADSQSPYQFSHVYVAAYPVIDGVKVRVPLDASHGPMPGWEAEQVVEVKRKEEWSVGGAISGLLGWVVEAAGFAAVGIAVWKMAGMAREK